MTDFVTDSHNNHGIAFFFSFSKCHGTLNRTNTVFNIHIFSKNCPILQILTKTNKQLIEIAFIHLLFTLLDDFPLPLKTVHCTSGASSSIGFHFMACIISYVDT